MNERSTRIRFRLWLGAFIAPLSPPLLYFVLELFVSGYISASPSHFEKLLWEVMFAIAPVAYGISFLIGAPCLLLLNHLGRLNMQSCVLSGLLLGAVVGVGSTLMFTGPPQFVAPIAARFGVTLLGATALAITAGVFGLIAGLKVR